MTLRAKLHSTDPKAVKATENTILQLINMTEVFSCVFRRKSIDDDADLAIDNDGWVELHAMPQESFLLFACVRQGYVKEMEMVGTGIPVKEQG